MSGEIKAFLMTVKGVEEERVAKILTVFALEIMDIKCVEDTVGPTSQSVVENAVCAIPIGTLGFIARALAKAT